VRDIRKAAGAVFSRSAFGAVVAMAVAPAVTLSASARS
jgi:hypothetical protein